jgi:predicted O-methyltransferase YrrM
MQREEAVAAARAALDAALTDATAVDLSWIQPPPAADDWTLAPDALRFLTSLVRHLQPRHILEFGSGLSTKVLARACFESGPSVGISSVDHDPEFGRRPGTASHDHPLRVRVRFQLAPVVARDCGAKLLPVYLLRPDRFASRCAVDLVLIDGPPITLGGREGVLYQVMDFARPGTLVLLDDAQRRSERSAVGHWVDTLEEAIEVRTPAGFTKGLAAIIIREPVPRRELWERKLALAKRWIEGTVAPGGRFVLIEQDYWPQGFRGGLRSEALVQRAGEPMGLPEDDRRALGELEQRRQEGATHVVFLWTAFWWLDAYAGFFGYLRTHYRCAVENDLLVAFDLTHAPGDDPASPGRAAP